MLQYYFDNGYGCDGFLCLFGFCARVSAFSFIKTDNDNMVILDFIKNIGWSGYFDILMMSFLIYVILVWFKRTKAAFVMVGILIISGLYMFARQFDLRLTEYVFRGFFAVILVALVVIFQEELKHFFERLAVWSLNRRIMTSRVLRPSHEWSAVLARTAS